MAGINRIIQVAGSNSLARAEKPEQLRDEIRNLTLKVNDALRQLSQLVQTSSTSGGSSSITVLESGEVVTNHGILTGLADDDHPQYLNTTRHAAIDAADHGSGGAANTYVLSADGGGGTAWRQVLVSGGGVIYAPSGISTTADVTVWRAPYACRVINVRGLRVGGSSASINARRNGVSNHLASDLSLSSTGVWLDGGAVQNTDYAAGDTMEIRLTAVSGLPTEIAVQVDLRRI